MSNYRFNWMAACSAFMLTIVISIAMIAALQVRCTPQTPESTSPCRGQRRTRPRDQFSRRCGGQCRQPRRGSWNQPARCRGQRRQGSGINQPVAVGNVGSPRGSWNQPARCAGNVGRDPGINQPGAAGNRPGVRR